MFLIVNRLTLCPIVADMTLRSPSFVETTASQITPGRWDRSNVVPQRSSVLAPAMPFAPSSFLLLLVRHLLLEAMHLLLVASLLLVAVPFAPSSFLLLLVRHLLLEAMHLLLVASLLLVAMPFAPSSFLLLLVRHLLLEAMHLLLVAMPFAPSSFLLLAVRPTGAPSSFFSCLGSQEIPRPSLS